MMIALLLATAAPAAPADVVRSYYAQIDARRYAAARAMWRGNARYAGPSLAAFRRGYARTASAHVRIGDVGPAEGGAGSLYVTVPVRVDARLNDGTRQRFAGSYVVRRVNDVPGSTPAQRAWHLDSARLRALP